MLGMVLVMEKLIYLDHAAATPLDPRVFEAMRPFFMDDYANPSSFHSPGKVVRDALEDARDRVACVLECRGDEVIFTSGGTESDNQAILGVARKHTGHGKHIISCASEHEAVLEALDQLKKEGFEVTLLKPDAKGLITPDQVLEAVRLDTVLVTLMYANNEIGTIHPIAEIGARIAAHREQTKSAYPLFHTDACQAPGFLPLSIPALHVDLLTLNGSKMYGPKGIGALYTRRGVKWEPLLRGGSQEQARRPGTEYVAGIVGFARALEIADAEGSEHAERMLALRDRLIDGILSGVPKTRLNGDRKARLANNVNISFMDVEGEALLLYLDAKGIAASTGSACTSKSLDPSHVILSLGVPYEVAHGSIRFSLGRQTTQADIDTVLRELPPLVAKLRAISPVHVDPKYYE